jgi:uncharacterized protein (TIGR02246 family)
MVKRRSVRHAQTIGEGARVVAAARRAALVAALSLSALVAVAQDRSASDASLEADLAAIEDFNRRYVQAINDGDIDTLAALTTDDHLMITPNRPPLAGKAALVAAMTRAFEGTEIDETWTPVETVVDGDLAYQRGTYTVAARPKGSDAEMRTTSGSFLRIYRRQPNGEWRMTRDTFNTYPPEEE